MALEPRLKEDHRGGGHKSSGLRAILFCSNSHRGHYVLQSLHSLGFRVALVYDQRSAASVRLSRRCDTVLLASPNLAQERPATVLRAVNNYHAGTPVDVVLGTDIGELLLLGSIRDSLVPRLFPMPEPATLALLHNKWHFYNLCSRLSIDVPRTLHFSRRRSVDRVVVGNVLGYPAVVKPVAQHGGKGFMIAENPAELDEVIEGAAYRFDELLVQEFIGGTDLSLSLLARNGEVIHWTTFLCEDAWGAMFVEIPELVAAGQRIVAELKLNGVINFDARREDSTGAIKLLECNPRFFGRMVATRLCGLDFVQAGLAEMGLAPRPHPGCCRGRFYPVRQLTSLRGWKRLLAGQWPLGPTLRQLAELLADPLPMIAREAAAADDEVDPPNT